MTIASRIKKDIPGQIRMFRKLTAGKPYWFRSWKKDKSGLECLYYRFAGSSGTSQTKRVPAQEIEAAIKFFKQHFKFDRAQFKKLCPTALRSGPCGFAVIGRYLEFRYQAQYKGRGKGFRV